MRAGILAQVRRSSEHPNLKLLDGFLGVPTASGTCWALLSVLAGSRSSPLGTRDMSVSRDFGDWTETGVCGFRDRNAWRTALGSVLCSQILAGTSHSGGVSPVGFWVEDLSRNSLVPGFRCKETSMPARSCSI